ncbi:MAG: hypothetical protein K2P30_07060 [Lachnospiraceae bacterium]|nr:hypothetical protein [Lachnospiraceae bacterium]
MNIQENKWLRYLIITVCILFTIGLHIHAGICSYGFEGDEVFSYISSNSLGGFKGITYLTDQQWYDADYFYNALTATDGERFNARMVFENQAMDVHPPLYYLLLNFICSVFTGKFSKWFGIGLNIFLLILVEIGLYYLLRHFLKNKYMSIIMSTAFCCSRLSINMVQFIRMYIILMAICIWTTWLHLVIYKKLSENEYSIKAHWKSCLLLILITVSGALTHYYFIVYQCLMSGIFVLGLLLLKQYKNSLRYMGVMVVSAVLSILIYPAMLSHIFFKYRGRDAVYKFLKGGTLFHDVKNMLDELNAQLFKGTLLIILLILAAFTLIFLLKKKISIKTILKGGVLALPLIVYFYGISKASPFVSIRYVSPIAPMIFTFFAAWSKYLIDTASFKINHRQILCLVLTSVSLFITVSISSQNVKPEYMTNRQSAINKIVQTTDYCMYISGDEYYWKMWEDYVNYPQFKALYFINGLNKAPITDDKLKQQKNLLIYVDNVLDLEEMQDYLSSYLPLNNYEIIFESNYTHIIYASAGQNTPAS